MPTPTSNGRPNRPLYDPRTEEVNVRKAVKYGLSALALVTVLLLGSCSYYTVEQGERAVVKTWGEVTRVAEPGLNFKVPYMETATSVNVRTTKLTYEKLAAYSNDQQPFEMQVSVNISLDPTKVAGIYSQYGESWAENVVAPKIRRVAEETSGKYTAPEIVRNRQKFGKDFESGIRELMPDGIIIESVQIENVDFSDAYEQTVEISMKAELEVKTREQELRQAEVQARQQIIVAKTEAEKQRLAADATAYAVKAAGDAEAAAIDAKGKALRDNPALVSLIAAQNWDGKLPTTMVPGSAVPFVSLPTGQ